MDDKLSMKVAIDGRVYPLRVKRSEEERIRAAAKLINDRISIYKSRFNANEMSNFDFLAMVSIDLVAKYIDNENKTDDGDLISELRILSGEVDDYIQKSQAL
ncbi:MAG: cell division protein ZapA [Bacteroidales bacterium]|jgi:cell division protein ZapA|nr:cell division protein ZapA [Bacteroidales bacterium]MBQ5403834.1 cell division protein ZapA [Bacteroidales bacterium]MBR6277242.1 cell division protein ZapA [Bacteroidales bacterium]